LYSEFVSVCRMGTFSNRVILKIGKMMKEGMQPRKSMSVCKRQEKTPAADFKIIRNQKLETRNIIKYQIPGAPKYTGLDHAGNFSPFTVAHALM
jgi:hypothetical protein